MELELYPEISVYRENLADTGKVRCSTQSNGLRCIVLAAQWALGPKLQCEFLHPVDNNASHMINAPRSSPSIFVYCKQSKTGQWEGLGRRL